MMVSLAHAAEPHYLLQRPAMNASEIVFGFAGDLWSVSRSGGPATRLTTGVGIETDPVFSPDGTQIAFTGDYGGDPDVYVMPAAGGVPKRLTFHPGTDEAVGWTPDGKNVIFRSNRESNSPRYTKLFAVPVTGGLPRALPLPMGYSGSYSTDGKRFAYAPVAGASPFSYEHFVAWRRYRGGLASYIWITDFPDLKTTKIPRETSNDYNPMWVGNKVYFLSDRNGAVTLFSYQPASGAITQAVENNGFDIRSASAGPGGIVYDQFGELFIYSTETGKTKKVPVDIQSDFAEVRPHLENVSRQIEYSRISATGARAVLEAHGDILTVPAEKGSFRDITNTPGVMERQPAWAPDGQHIAYFSDESGLYALHVGGQEPGTAVRKFPLENSATYYFNPHWSPNSKLIAFLDNKLNIWFLNTESGKLAKVDTDYNWATAADDTAWSPDSKWLAYTRTLPNRLHAMFLYSVDSGRATQVTDGMSDARYPAFDKDGKYLYFAASTNYGPTSSHLDMSSDQYEVTRSVYAVVLSSDGASPVPPESDEEKPRSAAAPEKPAKAGETAVKPVRVDLTGIESRIVPLPLPPRNYQDLRTGKEGTIYVLEGGPVEERIEGRTLSKFDLRTRKTDKLADRIASFDISADGEKMLIEIAQPPLPPGSQQERPVPQMAIVSALTPVKPGEGHLNLAGLEVRVDPHAEWSQMYHEVWRIERSYFYDPHFHGVDTIAAEKEFEPYLAQLESRSDLNYLFQEMLGNFTVGHLRGGGGTIPHAERVPGGLLGADYEISNGRYRIKRIYTGGNWDPQLRAPLFQPGLKIANGDYILAINGQNLSDTDNIDELLEGTAGRSVVLKVASDASGSNAREVAVIPTASEAALRTQAWIEANRKKVDELSGGKLAYVYLPDTAMGGLTNFNRYFFAQTNKEAAVIDERFNSGGQAADYIIQVLNRELLSYWAPRYGAIYRTPQGSILGPKVMIVNEFAGSGGDAMPWYFRYAKVGQLIGKRTWGGLVGISGYPTLMDGGTVTAPSFGFFSPSGEWSVENHGVPPDIEVDMDPLPVAEGHDPQLERAVTVVMSELEKNPPPKPKRPPYPNYNRALKAANAGETAAQQ